MDNLQDISINSIKVISKCNLDYQTAPLHVLGGSIFDKNMLIKEGLQVGEKLKVNGELFCNNLVKLNSDLVPLKDTNNIGAPNAIWYQLYAREGIYNKIQTTECISDNLHINNLHSSYKIYYNTTDIELENHTNIIFLTEYNCYNYDFPCACSGTIKKVIIYNYCDSYVHFKNLLFFETVTLNYKFITLEMMFIGEFDKWCYLNGNFDSHIIYENASPANPEQNSNTL